MQGKYRSFPHYAAARLQRLPLRLLARTLAKWEPQGDPQPGYSIIIGAVASLPGLLRGNLASLAHQKLDRLHQTIVVFDSTRTEELARFADELVKIHPELRLRFVFYARWQAKVCDRVSWGWLYAWQSWALGVGCCETRYAAVHDFDAFAVRDDFFEYRYDAIRESGAHYLGDSYKGNGIPPNDFFIRTPEMLMDVAYARSHGLASDAFSRVGMYNGHGVDFDTFLYAQLKSGATTKVMPIPGEELVHPSQVLCQYTELKNSSGPYTPPRRTNLPLLPYFLYLGGDEALLTQATASLAKPGEGHASGDGKAWMRLEDKTLDLSTLAPEHWDFLEQQMTRLERGMVGAVRPAVRDYFAAIRQRVFAERAGAGEREDHERKSVVSPSVQ